MMTEQHKVINILQEIERAKDCLKSADILAENNQLVDGVSRLYYFVYHTMRALLLSKGLEPKTHEGMLRPLGIHFIKPETLPVNISHLFAWIMKYREEADYNALYTVSTEDYFDFRTEASLLQRPYTVSLHQNDFYKGCDNGSVMPGLRDASFAGMTTDLSR